DVRELMITLWTNFATYGNPTPHGQWEPLGINNRSYLEIGHDESKPGLYGVTVEKVHNFDKICIFHQLPNLRTMLYSAFYFSLLGFGNVLQICTSCYMLLKHKDP
ncbi:hypothetical protein L9F63_025407, partial [Diploptera punctata]